MRNKSRLTITLPKNLLKQVDALVDDVVIRNRSHAVETLIRKGLSGTVSTAVILAGGKKQRKTPPALKKIGNQHLLSVTLDHLKQFGITKIVLLAGFYEDAIRSVYGDGSANGVEITYITESEPKGTAGALRKAETIIDGEPFIVMNGDVLTNLNIQDFVQFHEEEGSTATMAVKPRMGERKYGQAFLQGNKIVKFLETGNQGISIVNTGVYVFQPEIFSLITSKMKSIETDIFPLLAKKKQLSAFIFQGVWEEVTEKKVNKEVLRNW